MGKKLGHADETPKGCLFRLENRYSIDRAPLKKTLEEAIERQRKLDAFVAELASEAARWKTLAHHLAKRKGANRRAAATRIAEIEESLLDDVTRARLIERETYLFRVIDLGLEARFRAARIVERLAQGSTRRKPHRPTAVIINECLKSLVEQARKQVKEQRRNRQERVPAKSVASEYVSALAQTCGLFKEVKDPAAALEQQIRRHAKSSASLSDTAESLFAFGQWLGALPITAAPLTGTTLDEVAVSAADLARGRWPEPLRFKPSQEIAAAPVRRRRLRSPEDEHFYNAEKVLMSLLLKPAE